MPLGYTPTAAERAAFTAHLEAAVQSFVRRATGGVETGKSATSATANEWPSEEAELMTILKLCNREVLRTEARVMGLGNTSPRVHR